MRKKTTWREWAERNSRLLQSLQVAGLILALIFFGITAGICWHLWHTKDEEREWLVRPFSMTAPSVRIK